MKNIILALVLSAVTAQAAFIPRGGSTTVVGGTPVNPNTTQLSTNGAGTLLNIQAGSHVTNMVFETPNGANGHAFVLQTNVGPGLDIYDFAVSRPSLRFFGDDYGYLFYSRTGTTNWLSLGHNLTTGDKEPVLRAYPEYTSRPSTFVRGPSIGAGINAILPEQGGHADAMAGLRLYGSDIWKRLPVPPLLVVTAGTLIYFDPNTNGNKEVYYTNTINNFNLANFTHQMRDTYGIPVWFEIETWMTTARNGSGQLQFNSSFPSGGTYLSRYAITNGGLLHLHIDWSAHPGSLVNGKFPGTYTAMTPYSVATDVAWGYNLGIAGFRVGDGQADNTSHETYLNWVATGSATPTVANTGDQQGATGFIQQELGHITHELLYPQGYTPQNMGYTNTMMALDAAIYAAYNYSPTLGPTVPEMAAYLCNNYWDDQGRQAGPNPTLDIDTPLYQMRLTWTNVAWLSGKGHYFSHVYADNLQHFGVTTIADTKAHLAAQAMFPGPLTWFGSNVSATISAAFTNREFQAIFADEAQLPSFPAFDNGSGGTSAWIKPLSDGGFMALLANEAGSSGNVTLNWSQISSPTNFIPIGSTLYPFKPNTNTYYSVRDVWGAADLGVFNGSITRNVGAHNIAWLRFTPKQNYYSSLAVTNAGGTIGLAITNTGNLGTNVLHTTGQSLMMIASGVAEGPVSLTVQHKAGAAGGGLHFRQNGATYDIADFGMQGNGGAIGYMRYARQLFQNSVNSTEFQWYNSSDTLMGYVGNAASGHPVGYFAAPVMYATNGLVAVNLSSFLAADATTTTATMANTALSCTVISGHKYTFIAELFLSDSVAADGARIDFDGGAATATAFICQVTAFDTALNLSTQTSALATDIIATTFTGAGAFECHGSFEPSSSGTFIIRFAQSAHTTGTLTLKRGSNVRLQEIL